jgi:sortase A
LWVGGVLALLWVAWGWLDARIYQSREEQRLEAALLRDAAAAPPPTAGASTGIRQQASTADGEGGAGQTVGDGVARSAAAASAARPVERGKDGGAASTGSGSHRSSATGAKSTRVSASLPLAGPTLARIVIPRVGIGVMVLDDVDHRSLRRGVGHIPGTAPLGSAGNVGIAGHRDTFFRPLKDVRIGDDIELLTPGAITTYKVEWAEVMGSEDAAPLRPTDYPAMTLVTCYPFYYVGSAPDRFVVRARLVESRAATAADARRLLGR